MREIGNYILFRVTLLGPGLVTGWPLGPKFGGLLVPVGPHKIGAYVSRLSVSCFSLPDNSKCSSLQSAVFDQKLLKYPPKTAAITATKNFCRP